MRKTVGPVAAICCGWALAAFAQQPEASPAIGDKPALTASLVDADKNAARGAATVTIKVNGVSMVDPASAAEVPKAGQGHLHYRVDDGPIVATTSTKLSFHELKPGQHRIVVELAANDHSPLGAKQELSLRVPEKR